MHWRSQWHTEGAQEKAVAPATAQKALPANSANAMRHPLGVPFLIALVAQARKSQKNPMPACQVSACIGLSPRIRT